MADAAVAVAIVTYTGTQGLITAGPPDAPMLMTDYEMRVEEVVKFVAGDLPPVGHTFRLRLHGGRREGAREVQVVRVKGIAALQPGRRYLVFLGQNQVTGAPIAPWDADSLFEVSAGRLRSLRLDGLRPHDGLPLSQALEAIRARQ